MSVKEILDYVKSHPSGKVKIAFTDIDGVLRGKYMSVDKFLSVAESTTGFCDVIFGWDMGDHAYEKIQYTGWHTGYPDAAGKLDLATFRKIPWEDGVAFFLGDFVDQNNQPCDVCPRQLLRKIANYALNAGYKPVFSQEFEWYNFSETPESAQQKLYRNLTPLTPGMFGYSILRSRRK